MSRIPKRKVVRGGKRLGAGRKTEVASPMRRINITIDDESIAIAKKIGNENISLGVREALRIAADAYEQEVE